MMPLTVYQRISSYKEQTWIAIMSVIFNNGQCNLTKGDIVRMSPTFKSAGGGSLLGIFGEEGVRRRKPNFNKM